MRGVRLDDLVEQLRAEIGHSTNPAVSLNAKDYLVQVLRRTQLRLWEDHDWSFFKASRDIILQKGQRYYSVPNDLSYERINEVSFKYGDCWHTLCFGINERQYSVYDSDRDVRSWPLVNWDIAEDTGVVDDIGVIELWPVPARSTGETDGQLRVTGYRKLRPMLLGSDVCEIDGTLIVLTAAAEIQARQNQADAAIKLTMANNLLSRLQGQSTAKKKFVEFGADEFCNDEFRPRMIGSVTSLGGGGSPGGDCCEPPFDLSENALNDLSDVNAIPSDGFIIAWDEDASNYIAIDPTTLAPPSDGVEEAPEDGNTYGRKDADWIPISTAGGDYLPRDGSLPMEGPLNLVVDKDGNFTTWYSDLALTHKRLQIRVDEDDGLGRNLSSLRILDAEGNDGERDALLDMRAGTSLTTPNYQSAVVLQRGETGDLNRQFIGVFALNNVKNNGDSAEFAFQGVNEADRRAWFGTDYRAVDDSGRGLNNLQLYIDRPDESGLTRFLEFRRNGIYSPSEKTLGDPVFIIEADGRTEVTIDTPGIVDGLVVKTNEDSGTDIHFKIGGARASGGADVASIDFMNYANQSAGEEYQLAAITAGDPVSSAGSKHGELRFYTSYSGFKRKGMSLTHDGDLHLFNARGTKWFAGQDTNKIRAEYHGVNDLSLQRVGFRLFDIDGNYSTPQQVDGDAAVLAGDNKALVDIRAWGSATAVNSGVVCQRNLNSSTSSREYFGVMGFNNLRKDQDYAQFIFQDENSKRWSWLGTDTFGGPNRGLKNIQLNIDRPAGGDNDLINMAIDGNSKFRVDELGNIRMTTVTGTNIYVSGLVCEPPNGGGAINLQNNYLYGLRTPAFTGENDTQAASLTYVKNYVAQQLSGYLKLTGGVMSGDLEANNVIARQYLASATLGTPGPLYSGIYGIVTNTPQQVYLDQYDADQQKILDLEAENALQQGQIAQLVARLDAAGIA